MGLNRDLKDQLVFYGSYHANPWNQLIHLIFVPALWWTAAVWLAYTPSLGHLGALLPAAAAQRWGPHLAFNASAALAAAYSSYYVALEPLAGLSWAGLMGLPMWAAANWFRATVPDAWAWALGVHVASWAVQVGVGHQLCERRKPALLDSFNQSLVLAPLFVWFEVLFALGLYRGLHGEVSARVAANINAFRANGSKKAA